MNKMLLTLFACACLLSTAFAVDVHGYDVQLHPIHGNVLYGDYGGYATSVRYDRRYPSRVAAAYVPAADPVYTYVAPAYAHSAPVAYVV